MSLISPFFSPDRPSALGISAFRRYFVCAWLASMGAWINRFLLGWIAWELTHSALWVGIISACMMIPAIFLSPLFGVLSDRVNPRNGVVVTLVAQGFLALVAAGATTAGVFSLPWLLGVAITIGAVSSAHHPLRLALIPLLVPRALLPSAVGLSSILFNLSRILGPAVAGPMVAFTTVTVAFFSAALLFGGAVVALVRVPAANRNTGQSGGSFVNQLMEGVKFAGGNDLIRVVLMLTLINGLLGRAVIELLPAISGRLLNGDATLLATLTAAAGIGSVIGGLLLTRQGDDERRMARLVVFSMASGALVLLPINWLTNVWLLAPAICYLSLAATMTGISSQTLVQLVVPEHYRGRIMSLWTMLAMGAPAVGSFIMGALADRLGLVSTLVGFASSVLVIVLVLRNYAVESAGAARKPQPGPTDTD